MCWPLDCMVEVGVAADDVSFNMKLFMRRDCKEVTDPRLSEEVFGPRGGVTSCVGGFSEGFCVDVS